MRGKLGKYCLEATMDYKSRLCKESGQETALEGVAVLQANGPLVVTLSKITGKHSDLEMAGHSLQVSRLDAGIHTPYPHF